MRNTPEPIRASPDESAIGQDLDLALASPELAGRVPYTLEVRGDGTVVVGTHDANDQSRPMYKMALVPVGQVSERSAARVNQLLSKRASLAVDVGTTQRVIGGSVRFPISQAGDGGKPQINLQAPWLNYNVLVPGMDGHPDSVIDAVIPIEDPVAELGLGGQVVASGNGELPPRLTLPADREIQR